MSDIVERLHRGVDTNVPPDKTDRLMAEAADEIERLKAALRKAETVMMIVEPRSHKAEYLEALASARAALVRLGRS